MYLCKMERKGKIHIVIIAVLLSFLPGCELFIFNDPGQVRSTRYTFESFSNILIQDIFDVELCTDSTFELELETNEKYFENIVIEEDSGKLIISDFNSFKWIPEYPRPKLRICFPELKGTLLLNSPVNLSSSDSLKLPKLSIQSLGKTAECDLIICTDLFSLTTGSDNIARYFIRGRTRKLRLWPRGSSSYDASGLMADDCYIYNNSIGDCTVNVSGKLDAKLNTSGNVYYYGHPKEINLIEESGEGRLIPLE